MNIASGPMMIGANENSTRYVKGEERSVMEEGAKGKKIKEELRVRKR